ncbi:MAG: nucleotidyltransferase family protein [Chlorogloeopsis fritschii C42_A2020_084]|uniref:nucleotidyltransferase domain-containing protein n=1 Tax=Chlorogloeopsis fritschii TaxID=1124 RepID=UPI0019DE4CFB|nr:nucleotidyltransferase family protein [Chlorogloeopsis fritschii]MBF2004245.1 nucleotidyltransferase family protein [Chlorogloeopsis fritschii C42_A2020_084]
MIVLPKISTQQLPQSTSKEVELLLCCARTHITPTIAARIQKLLLEDIDWEYLMRIAQRHRVMPLLYHSLQSISPESVPLAKLNQLRKDFQANLFRSIFLTQHLLKFLSLFESNQIPALPFKGSILGASAYGNFSLRQTRDLDILVHKQHYQKAVDLLIAAGGEICLDLPSECHFLFYDRTLCIDLHCEIVPKDYSRSISDNYWWENLEPFDLAGEKVLNLSPEACFFMLCLQGTKDCWYMLHRICDVAEVIRTYPEMNWVQIMDQANRGGCKRIVSVALLLTKNLLEASLPEEVLKEIESDAAVKSVVEQVSKQLFCETTEEKIEGVPKDLFHMSTRERFKDRLQILVSLLNTHGWFTPTEHDLEFLSLPKFFYFLYYLIRPIRLIGRYRLSLLQYLRIKK